MLANILMIRAVACRWAISQGPSDSGMCTDSYLEEYMLVTTLAQELITKKANFIFDMTLGASIFSASHHCRNPKIRRLAIDLLHVCPKEGWFNTVVAAKISKWLMDKEEGGNFGGYIPETARLRLIKHELGPNKAELYCSLWKDENTREMLPHVTII